MTDGQLLFAVFAALYLIECLRWIPLHSSLCTGRTDGFWRFTHPSKNFGARGMGAAWLTPLPPFRAHFATMPWLFVPEGDHLIIRDETRAGSRFAWDKIDPRTDGSTLIIGGLTFLKLPSESLAVEWCARLREWIDLPALEREKSFLDHAAATLDADAVKKTATRLAEQTRLLHTNAALILLWAFGVVSAIHAWYGETARLWIALVVLLGLQITQAVLFWKATQNTEPDALVRHRFWKTLSIALMPQLSARAADHICRTITRVPHPLAARLLLDLSEFRVDARRYWREARFQKGWQIEGDPPLEVVALTRFFKESGIAISTLEEPPLRDDASASYCPRCTAQFQTPAGECLDCDHVELRPF